MSDELLQPIGEKPAPNGLNDGNVNVEIAAVAHVLRNSAGQGYLVVPNGEILIS